MGTKTLKKKHSKRQNFTPQASMASPQRRKPSRYTTVLFLLSTSLFIAVISLLVISSNKWRFFKSGSSLEMVQVVNEFPHDLEAFTQGLLYAGNDTLFESTGLYGKSSVRKIALHSGKIENLQKMDDSLFGEGLTLLGERQFRSGFPMYSTVWYFWSVGCALDGWTIVVNGYGSRRD